MSRDRGPRLKKVRRVRALPGLVQSKYKKIRRVRALPGLVQSKYNIKIKKKTPFRIRRRMKGISRRGNSISFDRCRYALQALEPVWIEAETIEAGRRAIKRYVRDGAIWVLPDKHVTISTTKSRWGKHTWLLPNKPVTIPTVDPIYWMCKYLVCVIKPGDVLYEISGVSETIARKALARAADKMPTLLGYTTPIKTQFIYIK